MSCFQPRQGTLFLHAAKRRSARALQVRAKQGPASEAQARAVRCRSTYRLAQPINRPSKTRSNFGHDPTLLIARANELLLLPWARAIRFSEERETGSREPRAMHGTWRSRVLLLHLLSIKFGSWIGTIMYTTYLPTYLAMPLILGRSVHTLFNRWHQSGSVARDEEATGTPTAERTQMHVCPPPPPPMSSLAHPPATHPHTPSPAA
ncbi:hypothetical protein CGRA01v4_05081 [Colletotrichum graminicola]|nr:hypothetical protein CGRA01v4_05081 [Colletotrichum graminicola]